MAESRRNQWWYPNRCELEGCLVQDRTTLKKCSACNMVQYCCRDHQKKDWSAHKGECEVYQRIEARAKFYDDDAMLKRFPLRPAGKPQNPLRKQPSGLNCDLCLKSSAEVRVMKTGCCGMPICDTEGGYQEGSHSRDFCPRNHSRYTLCGNHGLNKACDKRKDWRECPWCQADDKYSPGEGVSDRLWRGLSSYNFYPLLSATVPRHGLCMTCNVCQKKFQPGFEGSGLSRARGLMCIKCHLGSPPNAGPLWHLMHGSVGPTPVGVGIRYYVL